MKRALPIACILVTACVFSFYRPERIGVAPIIEAAEGKASHAAEASASEERAVELERKEKAALFGYENFRQSQRGAGKAHPLFGDVLLIEPRSARRAVDDGHSMQVARQSAAMEAFVPRRSAAASFSPMANDRVTQGEVTALKEGVTATLTTLERQLIDEVFGETYPLVGRNFGAAWSNNVAGF